MAVIGIGIDAVVVERMWRALASVIVEGWAP